jgi:hypothetical protein
VTDGAKSPKPSGRYSSFRDRDMGSEEPDVDPPPTRVRRAEPPARTRLEGDEYGAPTRERRVDRPDGMDLDDDSGAPTQLRRVDVPPRRDSPPPRGVSQRGVSQRGVSQRGVSQRPVPERKPTFPSKRKPSAAARQRADADDADDIAAANSADGFVNAAPRRTRRRARGWQ